MTSDETRLQLDLTESITSVPQANNISRFIDLLEALRPRRRTVAKLATLMDVKERTARYYLDFGVWLRFVRPADDDRFELTSDGLAFVESQPSRGRLFATALFRRPLIQQIQRTRSDDFAHLSEPEATREAAEKVVQALTTLSEATAHRRASALTSMMRWAQRPGDLDWSSGQPVDSPRAPFDFHGQSFLSAYAARQFGSPRPMAIGIPRQVILFARADLERLRHQDWARASYIDAEQDLRWFGSIPINPSTTAVARRRGPDLRRLLISCNPYLAMLVSLLSASGTRRPPPATLTRDMYGLRLWHRDRDLGDLLPGLASLAQAIDLIALDVVPHLAGGAENAPILPASDDEVADLLTSTGILRTVDTSLELSPKVSNELRLPVGDNPTVWERLQPLRDDLVDALRRYDP